MPDATASRMVERAASGPCSGLAGLWRRRSELVALVAAILASLCLGSCGSSQGQPRGSQGTVVATAVAHAVRPGLTPRPTFTSRPTRTATPNPSDTPTPMPIPSDTHTPTPSETPAPTETLRPPTFTPTETLRPTDTPAPTPTSTPVASPTPVPTEEPTTAPAPSAGEVRISHIHCDGEKGSSEPDEYCEIVNQGGAPVNLKGWRLNAGDPGQDFIFPDFTLAPGQTCRVYTNEHHPEWGGLSFGYGRAIWANKGDCGYLYDASGREVSRECYGK